MKDTFTILREKFVSDKSLYEDLIKSDNDKESNLKMLGKIEYIDRVIKFMDELIAYID